MAVASRASISFTISDMCPRGLAASIPAPSGRPAPGAPHAHAGRAGRLAHVDLAAVADPRRQAFAPQPFRVQADARRQTVACGLRFWRVVKLQCPLRMIAGSWLNYTRLGAA